MTDMEVLIPELIFRDLWLMMAAAFLCLWGGGIQRKCIGEESDIIAIDR
jgi:hypothetical protein